MSTTHRARRSGRTHDQGTPHGREVAAYDYRDGDGALLYQVVRYADPKSFRQRRPDGQGGWVWNLEGVTRVLYRLPELLAADPWAPVFKCEGEKDVDRLRSLGLVAVCAPGGAGKWRAEYNRGLIGRSVIVLPDNDPAGHREGETIPVELHRSAASVRVLHLPGLPEGGDVSDWLDAGGTREELLRLAADAPTIQSPAAPETAAPEPAPLFGVRTSDTDDRAELRRAFLEAKERRRRAAYVDLLRFRRAIRRLVRDPVLTEGDKLGAIALVDITEALTDNPNPAGEYPFPLWKYAPEAGCSKQTLSSRLTSLERTTGVIVIRNSDHKQPLYDGASGLPLTNPVTGRLRTHTRSQKFVTPRVMGTALLEAVIDRTYAPDEERARVQKRWGAQGPPCHPNAAVIVETTTVKRCGDCGEVFSERTRSRRQTKDGTPLPDIPCSESEQQRNPAGARSDVHAYVYRNRDEDRNVSGDGAVCSDSEQAPSGRALWDAAFLPPGGGGGRDPAWQSGQPTFRIVPSAAPPGAGSSTGTCANGCGRSVPPSRAVCLMCQSEEAAS